MTILTVMPFRRVVLAACVAAAGWLRAEEVPATVVTTTSTPATDVATTSAPAADVTTTNAPATNATIDRILDAMKFSELCRKMDDNAVQQLRDKFSNLSATDLDLLRNQLEKSDCAAPMRYRLAARFSDAEWNYLDQYLTLVLLKELKAQREILDAVNRGQRDPEFINFRLQQLFQGLSREEADADRAFRASEIAGRFWALGTRFDQDAAEVALAKFQEVARRWEGQLQAREGHGPVSPLEPDYDRLYTAGNPLYEIGDVDTRPIGQPVELPILPLELEELKVAARVTVVYVVNVKGETENSYVAGSTDTRFDDYSLAKVRSFRFLPATKNGRKVNCRVAQILLYN